MISGRGDPKVENKCGTIGHPCVSVGEYEVYDPKDTSKGYVGVERIFVCEHPDQPDEFITLGDVAQKRCSRIRNPYFNDNSGTTDNDENEVEDLLREGGTLANAKFKGLLRSVYLDKKNKDGKGDASDQFEWYAYRDMLGESAAVAIYGEMPMAGVMPRLFDPEGIEMHPNEVMALVDAGIMRTEDAKCGPCPEDTGKKDEKGKPIYTSAIYHFTMDGQGVRLSNPPTGLWEDVKSYVGLESEGMTGILDKLRNTENIPGIDEPRRQTLIKEFERVYFAAAAQKLFQEGMGRTQKISILMTAAFMMVVGYPVGKEIYKRFFGPVKITNYRKVLLAEIAKNPDYHVSGLTEMARDAWSKADDPFFRHVRIGGETGSGKDMLVKEMLNLLVRNDPSVPEGFEKASIYQVSSAEMKADSKFRGTVADKVVYLIRKAKKGKVVLWIPEFDRFVLSGGTLEDKGEQVSELLLGELEDPLVQKNLIILATTARDEELSIGADNLIRRLHEYRKHVDPLSKVAENMNGFNTHVTFANHYRVKFSKEAIDASVRLGEALVRPGSIKIDPKTAKITIPFPRYFAAEEVLKGAAKLARGSLLNRVRNANTPPPEVTVEHVIQSVAKLNHISLDASDPFVRNILDPATSFEEVEAKGAEEMQRVRIKLRKQVAEAAGNSADGLFDSTLGGMSPLDSRASNDANMGGLPGDVTERDVFVQLRTNPVTRSLFMGTSDAVLTGMAHEYFQSWQALPLEERVAYIMADGGQSMLFDKGPLPLKFLIEKIQVGRGGLRAGSPVIDTSVGVAPTSERASGRQPFVSPPVRPRAAAPAAPLTEADIMRAFSGMGEQEAKSLLPQLKAQWDALPAEMRGERYAHSPVNFLEAVRQDAIARSAPQPATKPRSPFERMEEERRRVEGEPGRSAENRGEVGRPGLPPIVPPPRRGR
jgi:hypothetical protein